MRLLSIVASTSRSLGMSKQSKTNDCIVEEVNNILKEEGVNSRSIRKILSTYIQPLDIQKRTDLWMDKCFTSEVVKDKKVRNRRFLEEALELVQACECSKEDAHALVEYVYNRPVGEIKQEIGGTVLTLAVLCSAHNFDMMECAETELSNNWKNIDKIREKQSAKDMGIRLARASYLYKYSKLQAENEHLNAIILNIRNIVAGTIQDHAEFTNLLQDLKDIVYSADHVAVSTDLLTRIARLMKDWWYQVNTDPIDGSPYSHNDRAFKSAIDNGDVPTELADLIQLLMFHKNIDI